MASLKCPKCKSSNIELWSNEANVKKVKRTTSLNVNPLKPLTIFNHKEKIKKKKTVSKGKLLAGALTGGGSLFITGARSTNKNKELHCNNCGHLWKSK
ncbi:MAG: hypothetical protein ACRCZN_09940 [Lactococcus lactis]